MKKFFTLALVAVAAVFGANAQESFAPKAGDFGVEVKFNPFSQDKNTFSIDGLQGRYFLNDKGALRFGIGINLDSKKDNKDATNSSLWDKKNTTNFSINLGYENHFMNYKRVDLYAGVGLGFEMESIKQTTSSTGADDKIVETTTSNANGSYNEFAVKAFTGIDFYIYKGLYVGAELGLKLGVKSYPANVVKNPEGEMKGTSSSSFALATYAEPSLRLGWKF